jgi:hypothetical protein
MTFLWTMLHCIGRSWSSAVGWTGASFWCGSPKFKAQRHNCHLSSWYLEGTVVFSGSRLQRPGERGWDFILFNQLHILTGVPDSQLLRVTVEMQCHLTFEAVLRAEPMCTNGLSQHLHFINWCFYEGCYYYFCLNCNYIQILCNCSFLSFLMNTLPTW